MVQKRAGAVVAALVVFVAAFAVGVNPASANDDVLTLPGGEATVTLGPNAVLRIDGKLSYNNSCDDDGVNDFAYAASDIYLSATAPTAGADLEDVSGTPSTIVQSSSMFIDQLIAITAPSGTTGAGTYSIVYDTCQNGVFDPGEDPVFTDVVKVQFPAVLPPIDASIAQLKTGAHTEWGEWKYIGQLFDSIINIESYQGCAEKKVSDCLSVLAIWADSEQMSEWAETAGEVNSQVACASGDVSSCFGLLSEYWGFESTSVRDIVLGGAKSLIANQAKTFFGIYADPPRSDFTTPSAAHVDLPFPGIQGAGPVADSVSEFGTALQRDTALHQALLDAIERYQGAQAAGDPVAAVAQLRSAAAIATTLATSGQATANRTKAMFDAIHGAIPTIDDITQARDAEIDATVNHGFDAARDRQLRNAGVGASTRGSYFDAQRAAENGNIVAVYQNLDVVDDLVAEQAARSAHLLDAAAQFNATANDIVSSGASSDAAAALSAVPTLTLTGGPNASVGAPVSFNATASAGSTVTWDLDADGSFDDGAGNAVSPIYHQSGLRVIAAKSTNGDGTSVTAHALVDVTSSNAPPVIDAQTPLDGDGKPGVDAQVGKPTTFSVSAHDPNSDALSYAWAIDGVAVPGATGSSYTLTPTNAQRGAPVVSVNVTDGHPGNLAQAAWRVWITNVDADGDGWADNAVADCDDTDADVHPGRLEVLFNNKDDDCDASTPDGGTDLGEGGDLWAWGSGYANPASGGSTPTAVTSHAGDIVQATSTYAAGYWLTRDGQVFGVGPGPDSDSGVGPGGAVVGIGGTGTLQGIQEITNGDLAVYARTGDGHVVSWGSEHWIGSLGSGVTAWARNAPDYVLGPDTDSDGNPDPLGGVTKVWQIGGAGLARTSDGTLYQWGRRQCADAGYNVRPVTPVALPESELTTKLAKMVQADGSSNTTGSAIFRMADGSVMACGADVTEPSSSFNTNKLVPFGNFGPDNPAVDVETSGQEWWVVTGDGKVWVKTWETAALSVPGCTPTLCPPGVLHELPLPDDWHVVDIEASDSYHFLRLADGRLATFSDANDYGSLGHDAPLNTPTLLAIDGYVLSMSPQLYDGYAVVLPSAAIAASGWVAPQPDVTVSAVGGSGPEGGSVTAGIDLDKAASGDLVVRWSFGDATGQVTVPKGSTHVDVPLSLPAPDGVWGVDRHVPFVITSVSADASLGDEIADVTVTDADAPPTLSMSPGSVPEGDGARVGASITVSLSSPAGVDVPVHVTSTDGTAHAGVDFAGLDADAVIPAGASSVNVPLMLFGNTIPEPDRALTLTATPGVRGLQSVSSALTITDDDPLALEVSAPRVNGGTSASVTFKVPCLVDGEQVVVGWSTADGSALAGTDYSADSGTVTLSGTQTGECGPVSQTVTLLTSAVTAPGTQPQLRYLALNLDASSGAREVLVPDSTPVGILQQPAALPTTTTSSTTSTSTTSTTTSTTTASTTTLVPTSTTRPSTTSTTVPPSSNAPTSTSRVEPTNTASTTTPTPQPPPMVAMPATAVTGDPTYTG